MVCIRDHVGKITVAAAVALGVYLYRNRRIRFPKSNLIFGDEDEQQEEQLSNSLHSGGHFATGAQKLLISSGYNAELVRARHAAHNIVKDLPPIPELSYTPSAKYHEATKEEVLNPLIDDSDCILVPGAYFGDEGKGKTVDAIARHPAVKVVARVNSGENAGHTVFGDNGHKYDFHLCPSGLLTPGKVNVIGPECVMDPVSFMEREISQLTATSVAYLDRLFVGNVHLVCPHHKLLDLIKSWESPNSSTLQGMGPVHASKASRSGLRLDHLFNDRAEALKRLEQDMRVYYGALKDLGVGEEELLAKAKANNKIQKHVLGFIEAKDKGNYVLSLFDRYVVNNDEFPRRADVSHMLRQAVKNGDKVLLEGPQSYFLSNAAEKIWDSGTSANTDASGMLCASRLNLTSSGLRSLVINVHKTPGSSRVGSGANPCSFVPQHYFSEVKANKDDFEEMHIDWRDVSKQYFAHILPNGIPAPGKFVNAVGTFDLGVAMAAATCIHPSHREFGVTSGRPRVVGFFDCVAQAELISVQGPYCSISALDRGDEYDEYAVCIAYVFAHPEGKKLYSNGREFTNGTIIKAGEQLPTQQVLYYCLPIVKKVRGWRETPIFARSDWWRAQQHPVKLPDAVCELLDLIEHFTGTQIVSIGNGPRGEDIIYITRAPETSLAASTLNAVSASFRRSKKN